MELPFTVLFSAARLLGPESVVARVSAAHQRLPFPPLDGMIGALWDKAKKEKGDHIFNDWKFRLDGVEVATEDEGQGGQTLTLRLGITDYRTSYGISLTRYDEYAAAIPDAAQLHRHLPQTLGVEIVCVTADGRLVFFRRSSTVSEFPGYYCSPGGHPEPKSIFDKRKLALWRERFRRIHSDKNNTENDDDDEDDELESLVDFFQFVDSKTIVRELFLSAAMEVSEELGVAEDTVSVALMGSTIAHANNKPDLCFLARLPHTADEVSKRFNSRAQVSADESVEDSLLLPDAAAVLASEESILAYVHETLGGKMTPCSISCLWLARRYF